MYEAGDLNLRRVCVQELWKGNTCSMNAPEVTLDEALKFRAWLKEFGLALMTTVMNDHIYLVDIREEYEPGKYRYFSQKGSSKVLDATQTTKGVV